MYGEIKNLFKFFIIHYNQKTHNLPKFKKQELGIVLENVTEETKKQILSLFNTNTIEVEEKEDYRFYFSNGINYVIKFLTGTTEDPNVLSIKITLYRTAKNSRVIDTLLKAAENGKHVSVLFSNSSVLTLAQRINENFEFSYCELHCFKRCLMTISIFLVDLHLTFFF